MNKPVRRISLDEVLDAYMTEAAAPQADILAEWIRRYPQFERELMEFAVAWAQTEWMPKANGPEVDNERLVLRGMSIVRNLLHEQRVAQVHTSKNVESLVRVGAAKEISLDTLATRTRLSPALVRKLDLGRIASVPSRVIAALAEVVGVDHQTVGVRVRAPQQFATRGKFRANEAPTLGERQDFFAAVCEDPEMTEEDKAYWLRMRSDESQSGDDAS